MKNNVIDHPAKLSSNYFSRGSGPRLVAFSSIIRGKVFTLEHEQDLPVVIGANVACDHVITGSTMSDFHVAIEWVEGVWMVSAIDEGARAWVNNEPVVVALLEHGDQVQLGRHLFVFLDDVRDDDIAADTLKAPRFFKR